MQNLFKKVTGKIRKNMSNIIAVAGGIATTAAMYGIDVYADANTSEITGPINTVLTIFKAIVMAIGGIILLKNIVETAQAYQQQDSSGSVLFLTAMVCLLLDLHLQFQFCIIPYLLGNRHAVA